MIEKVGNYLQAKGLGVIGKSIFEYEMPRGCDNGILLLDNYYGVLIDWDLPGYKNTALRVVIRASDLAAGKVLANQVKDALTIQGGDFTEMPGIVVQQSLPANEPRVYPRSIGSYWELEMDVPMQYAEI